MLTLLVSTLISFHRITPHLKLLHLLKITQRIQYEILSITYKSLQFNKPPLLIYSPFTTNLFHSLVWSCNSPMLFPFLSAQNFWHIFPLSSSSSLKCSTKPFMLSFSDVIFSNSIYSRLSIFKQQHLPYSSSLSSYWIDPLHDASMIWSSLISMPFIHSTPYQSSSTHSSTRPARYNSMCFIIEFLLASWSTQNNLPHYHQIIQSESSLFISSCLPHFDEDKIE